MEFLEVIKKLKKECNKRTKTECPICIYRNICIELFGCHILPSLIDIKDLRKAYKQEFMA